MKRRIISLLLAMCVCIACLPISVSAAAPEWSAAYRDFILSGRYVNAFKYESSYYPLDEPWGTSTKWVMLLDMDKDDTPELLISNGHDAQLERASYIFTYSGGQIHYIGSGPDYPIYYPGTSVPGISGDYAPNGGADTHTVGYRWKEGNTIQRETVYTCDMYGNNVVQITTNDELFRVCRAGGEGLYKTGIDLSELNSANWDSFVNTAIPGTIPDTPTVKPSFTDVPAGAFYAVPVAWAVENDITSGTSSTTFGPNAACTRGQIVTFLWRAAGKPEPSGSCTPFADVRPSDYFYKAVLWAVENDITAGTDSTHFSPNAVCTRGQAVTFLWRAAGEPGNSLSYNPFKDVKPSAYYYDAVLWAADNGITSGTSGRLFSPEDRCNRGQIVTFLYRHYVEPADVVLPVPEEEIYKSITGSLYKAKTSLYDINDDGTDELFVLYGEDSGKKAIMFSIYTINNSTVMPIVENEVLQMMASVPSGGVGIVEKAGKRYLYTCGRNSGYTPPHDGQPGHTSRTGTLMLYSVSGAKLTLAEKIEYQMVVPNETATPSETTITRTVSGKSSSMSYQQYKIWVDSLTWKMRLGSTEGKVNAYF